MRFASLLQGDQPMGGGWHGKPGKRQHRSLCWGNGLVLECCPFWYLKMQEELR